MSLAYLVFSTVTVVVVVSLLVWHYKVARDIRIYWEDSARADDEFREALEARIERQTALIEKYAPPQHKRLLQMCVSSPRFRFQP